MYATIHKPRNGYSAEYALHKTVETSPLVTKQLLPIEGKKFLSHLIKWSEPLNNRHINKRINQFIKNNNNLILVSDILDFILGTDIIIKVKGVTIALDLTLKNDVYKLQCKQSHHQSIYPYMRKLGVEKMIVLVWANDVALTQEHLLALVDVPNFSIITI